MDFTNWKFRASQMGQLMAGVKPNLTEKQQETLNDLLIKRDKGITDTQTKLLGSLLEKRDQKPKLLATAKNLCNDIFQEQVFGRSKDIKTKYMEKGLSQEELSISLYTKMTGELLFKNETNFKNDFFTGTPDNTQEKIRDIKTSWDYSTFPMHDKEITNKGYIYQLNTYMNLTGLEESELIYCLVDTPFNLIDDELRKLSWKSGCLSLDSMPIDLKVETVSNLIYTEKGLKEYCHQSTDIEIEWFEGIFKEIQPEHRLKIFELIYDPGIVKQMKDHVYLGREYLNEIAIRISS